MRVSNARAWQGQQHVQVQFAMRVNNACAWQGQQHVQVHHQQAHLCSRHPAELQIAAIGQRCKHGGMHQ